MRRRKILSVLIEESLLRLLNEPGKGGVYSAPYHGALAFLAQLVGFGANKRRGCISCNRDYHFRKYVCGCHEESNAVQTLFRDANRIEACLKVFPAHGSVTLEVIGYKRGEKERVGRFEFTFNSHGQPSVGSYCMPSTAK